MTLSAKNCTACRGGIDPLTEAEARTYLKELPNWALVEGARAIERKFTFKNFLESQSFVNKVGAIAEAEGHHPDISFGWGYATIRIQTHKINGLHENDFILAAKVDAIT